MTAKLKIGDNDAALVFRRDGVVEMLMPRDGENAQNNFITDALLH